MKFLITNYSSDSQTECFYLNAGLNMIDGISCTMWDNNAISAYDIFDKVQPNYFITHINNIFTDVVSYVQNENKDIRFIINTTGATDEYILKTEKILRDEGIGIAFFFTNSDDVIKLKKTNMMTINLGADVFLDEGKINYSIDKAFLVNNKINIDGADFSYHTISYNNAIKNDVDIVLPISSMANIYKNYKEFILTSGGTFLPQVFFDAIFYGNKVYYDLDDSENLEVINNRIKKLFRIDYLLKDNEDHTVIKNIVKTKHTCLHRVKTLLSQLPANDYIKKLDEIIKIYSGGNK